MERTAVCPTVGDARIVTMKLMFPVNPENSDYIAYLAWVAEGNTPTPADEGTQ